MSDSPPVLPHTLEAALIPVRKLGGVELTSSWTWHAGVGHWALRCTLRPDGIDPNGLVPAKTQWYVVARGSYPEGSVRFCPAREGGIKKTHPHMLFNREGSSDVPWRSCYLCLDTRVRALGRFGGDSEPSGYRVRLAWQFQRALHWLELASRGELTKPSEPFELPVLPQKSSALIAFSESPGQLGTWSEAPRCGRAHLKILRQKPDVAIVTGFETLGGELVTAPPWGRRISDLEESTIPGVWVRLDALPVLEPWQAPETWAELREICQQQGINLNKQLRKAIRSVDPGKPIVLLVGFPLPAKVGHEPHRQHWHAAVLPARKKRYDRKGFQPKGSWEGYRLFELTDGKPVSWAQSENWSAGEISTRGRFPPALTAKRAVLLGAGAVGSAVAELLVRGGLQRATLIDGQRMEMGNLVRHALALDAVREPKAQRLSERLNSLSPHADVGYINAPFPPGDRDEEARPDKEALLRKSDLVIDCTGEDSALRDMQSFDWAGTKHFISLSLGMHGRRLFCFYARGERFPYEAFEQKVAPWLAAERREFSEDDLQWEGTGCYHPVFEARQDDVMLLASLALKWLGAHLKSSLEVETARLPEVAGNDNETAAELVVFEQYEDDGCPGVRRAQLQPEYA